MKLKPDNIFFSSNKYYCANNGKESIIHLRIFCVVAKIYLENIFECPDFYFTTV